MDFYNSKRENNYQTNCHPFNAEYGKNKTVHPRHSALLLKDRENWSTNRSEDIVTVEIERNGEKDIIT